MLSYKEAQIAYSADIYKANEDGFNISDIFKYAGATLADTAITTANSLSFGLFDLGDTSHALHWFNEDLGSYYDAHREGVELGSFIGGIFLPGLAAAKAMKWAKEGTTMFSRFFNPAAEWEAKALDTLRVQGAQAAEYKNALSGIKWHTLKEGAAEGALYELSYAAFNNQHAYLENDYDLVDYAIGASLGSLVGPLKWIGKKKQFLEEANKLTVEFDTSKQIHHATGSMLQGGDELSFTSYQYNQELGNVQPRNIQGEARGQQKVISLGSKLRKTVQEMSSPEFAAHVKDIRPKGEPINLTGELNPYIDNLQDYLMSISIKNPEFFRGVYSGGRGFNLLKDNYRFENTRSAIVLETTGGYTGRRGHEIADVLFTVPPKNKSIRTLDQLEAEQEKLGITTDIVGNKVTLTFSNKPGTVHKQWAAEYLLQDITKNKNVEILGNTSSLSPNKKKLDSILEFELLDIDRPDRLYPYMDWVNSTQTLDSGNIVLDPMFPYRALSPLEALSASSAASDSRIVNKIRQTATVHTPMQYRTDTQSVAASDGYWIEGLFAGEYEKGSTRGIYELKGDDAAIMSKLQGLVINRNDKYFAVVRLSNGIDLVGREAIVDYIWNWKQAEAKVLADKELSIPQIARKLNLAPDIVEGMRHTGFKLPRGTSKPWLYEEPAATYLNNRTILIRGKGVAEAQKDEISALHMLDNDTYQAYHDEIVKNMLLAAPIPGGEVSGLYHSTLSFPFISQLRGDLSRIVTNINDPSIAFSSTDFQLRHLGDTGDLVVQMGKNLQKWSNDLHIRHMEDLSAPLVAVRDDRVSAQQFAIVYRKLGGLSGEEIKSASIDFDTGKIILSGTGKDPKNTAYMKYDSSDQDIVLTQSNLDFWNAYLPIRAEHQALNNVINKLQGRPKQDGSQLWLPNFNLADSFVGFKILKNDHSKFSMIATPTAKGLDDIIARGRAAPDADDYIYLTRNDDTLGSFNTLYRYAELESLQPTNTLLGKSGIMKQELPGDVAIAQVINNLRADTVSKMRNIMYLSIGDIIGRLDDATKFTTAAAGSSRGFFAQKIQRPTTISEIVRKTLLNESSVAQTPAIDWANNVTTAAINIGLNGASKLWSKATGKDGIVDFEQLTKDMRAAGIIPTWKDYDEYLDILKAREGQNRAQHWLAKNHSAIVTMNLRLAEVAHAAVTVLSAPIILSGEIQHIANGGPLYATKQLMEAFKFIGKKTPESKRVMEVGEKLGYTKSIVAEASEAIADLARLDNTNLNAKYKQTIKLLSKPSDWSEGVTRELAYAVGYKLAKAKHPSAPLSILSTHAGAFVTRTMGNYTSRQKPTMFQGTFGQTIGLYQTFMLTMGQNLYRYAEAADKKAIAMLLSGQATMFGVESLPFFKVFNEVAGVYASDDNEDITTTTYKIFGNTDDNSRSLAEFILYGLPSAAFGSGLYTRATLDPRSVINTTASGGVSYQPAILNAGKQIWDATFSMINSTYRGLKSGGGFKDMHAAALQGLALQSLWRPGARWAELAMGKSYDRKGEVVERDTRDIDEPFSIAARLAGTRPLKEQVLRNLRYKTRYYNQQDRDRREQIGFVLRRIISNGEDQDQIGDLMSDYVNKYHGTITGWNSILKSAYAGMDSNYAERLAKYASRQPAIADIAETYAN